MKELITILMVIILSALIFVFFRESFKLLEGRSQHQELKSLDAMAFSGLAIAFILAILWAIWL